MKYQVMFEAVSIQCETASQAVALAKEITSVRRTRSNGGPHRNGEGTAPLVSLIQGFGPRCRDFTKILIRNPEGVSDDKLAKELKYKTTAGIEGPISAVKNTFNRVGGDLKYSDVFEEINQGQGQGERYLKIRPAVFNQVKKALEEE